MRSRIKKWGNSLAVKIPGSIAEQGGFEAVTAVELSICDSDLVVSPSPLKYSLESLLEHITDDNRHTEFDWEVVEQV